MLLVLVSLVLRNPDLDSLFALLRESSRSGVDVNHRHRKAPLASGKWFISVGRILSTLCFDIVHRSIRAHFVHLQEPRFHSSAFARVSLGDFVLGTSTL